MPVSLALTANDQWPTTNGQRLVIRPAAAKGWFFALEGLLGLLRLFFSRGENTLFIPPDALMRVQAFENKFSRRDLDFRTVLGSNADLYRFFHQSLNASQ